MTAASASGRAHHKGAYWLNGVQGGRIEEIEDEGDGALAPLNPSLLPILTWRYFGRMSWIETRDPTLTETSHWFFGQMTTFQGDGILPTSRNDPILAITVTQGFNIAVTWNLMTKRLQGVTKMSSGADFCQNRGFNDKSVKTSKIAHLDLLIKIGYGPIA